MLVDVVLAAGAAVVDPLYFAFGLGLVLHVSDLVINVHNLFEVVLLLILDIEILAIL